MSRDGERREDAGGARFSFLLILGLVSLLTTLGCEPRTRYRLLSRFIDGMPSYEEWLHPKPEQRTRRPPVEVHYQQPAAFPKVGEQPTLKGLFSGTRPEIEKLKTWEEVEAALPKNKVGSADWGAALTQGTIAPLTSLTPGEKGIEEMPIEVTLKGAMPVTFPHAPHTRWLSCDNCHPDIFPMAGGTTEMTMEDLLGGKYCGTCHGKVAFDIPTGCPICHPEMGS